MKRRPPARRNSIRKTKINLVNYNIKRRNSRKGTSKLTLNGISEREAAFQKKKKKRLNLLQKLHHILINEGKTPLEHMNGGTAHIGDLKKEENKILYEEYVDLFKEEDEFRPPEKRNMNLDTLLGFNIEEIEPDEEEIRKHQSKISRLISHRISNDDDTYLQVTEMTQFEKVKVYNDKYPLLRIRKFIWICYA